MRQGLLAIKEGGVIYHEYSTHLESLFETQNIAGRDVIDFYLALLCWMRI